MRRYLRAVINNIWDRKNNVLVSTRLRGFVGALLVSVWRCPYVQSIIAAAFFTSRTHTVPEVLNTFTYHGNAFDSTRRPFYMNLRDFVSLKSFFAEQQSEKQGSLLLFAHSCRWFRWSRCSASYSMPISHLYKSITICFKFFAPRFMFAPATSAARSSRVLCPKKLEPVAWILLASKQIIKSGRTSNTRWWSKLLCSFWTRNEIINDVSRVSISDGHRANGDVVSAMKMELDFTALLVRYVRYARWTNKAAREGGFIESKLHQSLCAPLLCSWGTLPVIRTTFI